MAWFAILVAVLAGVANPFQSATNAELNKRLVSPLWAMLSVYTTGLLALLVTMLFWRQAFPGGRVAQVPWWAWTGGLISLASTVAGITMAQKLGSGLFTAASLTAAVVVSVALDHYGLVGMKEHAVSAGRVVGCVLLIAGVWLVAKF